MFQFRKGKIGPEYQGTEVRGRKTEVRGQRSKNLEPQRRKAR